MGPDSGLFSDLGSAGVAADLVFDRFSLVVCRLRVSGYVAGWLCAGAGCAGRQLHGIAANQPAGLRPGVAVEPARGFGASSAGRCLGAGYLAGRLAAGTDTVCRASRWKPDGQCHSG